MSGRGCRVMITMAALKEVQPHRTRPARLEMLKDCPHRLSSSSTKSRVISSRHSEIMWIEFSGVKSRCSSTCKLMN